MPVFRPSAAFWAGIVSASCWHGCCRHARPGPTRAGEDRPPQPSHEIALGFIAGILSGAQRLAHVAFLRADPMLSRLLAVRQMASQSTLSRFFLLFAHAGINQRAFTPLWNWAMRRLPSLRGGYSLDLDSTRLLHEDGHQEGVAVGYTRMGNKPCLHPLLAVLEEAKLVVGFWLRPGNSSCANNIVAFTLELLGNLPRHIRLRLIRADSGFCANTWLALLESQNLRYIVVARLLRPLQRLCRKETIWQPSEVPGTEVAEVWHEEIGWGKARRLILIRHTVAEKKRPGGKKLLEIEAYTFQALVTNLAPSVPPISVWRDYNARAGCEGVIKQLDMDFALDKLCLKKFFATEAAMSLAVVAYNLCVLFQRHLGWMDRVTATTLRFRLFTTGGIISQAGGRTTIRLAVPVEQRAWWRSLYEKLLSVLPNCNAIPSSPP
ncbi:MAG: IS1380 family transposase [Betaproteobacteria bacterium]